MTDKLVALRALIEAVEAGTWDGSWRWLIDHIWDIDQCTPFSDAYHGSLDAAKALHEALLPGWNWYCAYSYTVVKNGKISHVSGVNGSSPARAWLLAILRAYLYVMESK